MRRSSGWQRALALLCLAPLPACSGASQPALPAPQYREPQLPEWEPESQEQDEFGLDAALDSGEWVEEAAPAMGGAGAKEFEPASEQGN